MKKLFVFMVALLAAASCKKDNGEKSVSREMLVGKWEHVSITVTVPGEGEITQSVDADAGSSYWTFGSDGSTRADGGYDFDTGEWKDVAGTGSYELSGKRLTVKLGNESDSFEVRELTADRLVVVYAVGDGGGIALSFKRAR